MTAENRQNALEAQAGLEPRNAFGTILHMKPSELIRLSLLDLRAVIASPHTSVNMDQWAVFEGDICHVCLTGAVFLQEAGINKIFEHSTSCNDAFGNPQRSISFLKFMKKTEFGGSKKDADNIRRRIMALDDFRTGCWYSGLAEFGLAPEKLPDALTFFTPEDFHDNPEQFFEDMIDAAGILEEAGM